MTGVDRPGPLARPEPLAPPAGHFEVIVARARRRRRRRTTALTLASVAVLAAVGGLAVVLPPGAPDSLLPVPPADAPPADAPPAPAEPAPDGSDPDGSPTDPIAPTDPVTAFALPAGGPAPAGFAPYSVSTVQGVVYLLGDVDGCRPAGCTASMVRIVGEDRVGLPAPEVPISTDAAPGGITEVRFADPVDGWAYGEDLWSTHDGGATWEPQDVGGPVFDLAADDGIAYAVVGRECDDGGCARVALLSTAAAVDSWAPIVEVQGAPGGTRVSVADGIGIASLGESLLTYDGAEWVESENPCEGGYIGAVAASASGRSLLVLCFGQDATSVLRSDDVGASWEGVPREPVGPTGSFGTTLAAPTATSLVAGARVSEFSDGIAVTTDGGRVWGPPAGLPGALVAGGWRFVGASSATRVYALPEVPDGFLYISDDAGRTFRPTPV